jgi:hypothetical protein
MSRFYSLRRAAVHIPGIIAHLTPAPFLDLLSHATLTTVLDSANGAHESGQAQAERYK